MASKLSALTSLPAARTGRGTAGVPRRGRRAGRAADRAAEPSWPVVIATTLRLFVGRRVPGLRRWPRARWWGLAGMTAAVVALGAVSVLPGLGVGRADPVAKPHRPPARAGLAALRAAEVTRGEAARWVAAQVGWDAVVACDRMMCAQLRAAGFPARNLRVLAGPAETLRGAVVVVSAAALHGWFGNRLADAWAPVVAAGFGTGSARVQVRVAAPAGAAAYLAGLRVDWGERRWAGRQLLGNPRALAPGLAGRELAAGLVDARVLVTLAALADTGVVRVAAFGDAGPQATPGEPLRAAVLAGPAGPGRARLSYLRSLGAFVAAQRPPYRPVSVRLSRQGGQPELVIRFAAPSPLGLLGPAAYQNLTGR